MTVTTRTFTEPTSPEQRAKCFFETDFGIANRIGFFLTAFNTFRDFEQDRTFALNGTTFVVKLGFRVSDRPDPRFFIYGICRFKDENFTFPTIQFVGEGFGAELTDIFEGFAKFS